MAADACRRCTRDLAVLPVEELRARCARITQMHFALIDSVQECACSGVQRRIMRRYDDLVEPISKA